MDSPAANLMTIQKVQIVEWQSSENGYEAGELVLEVHFLNALTKHFRVLRTSGANAVMLLKKLFGLLGVNSSSACEGKSCYFRYHQKTMVLELRNDQASTVRFGKVYFPELKTV